MMSMPIQSSSHAASGDHLSAGGIDAALPGLLTMTIDRDALAHNAQVLSRNAQLAKPDHPAELMAVVKANGYNHGAVEAARVFLANGATQLGVATITEGLELRQAGISAPILAWIWNADDHVSVAAALDYGIDLGVPTLAHIRAIVDEATERKRSQEDWKFVPPRVTVMVDSGLSRSGISPDQWDEALKELSAASSDSIIDVTGAFTHLASADAADNPSNNRQKAQFDAAIEELQAAGIPVRINHMCNSPASVTTPDMFYQMVRPGVALYGMDPLEEPADRSALFPLVMRTEFHGRYPAVWRSRSTPVDIRKLDACAWTRLLSPWDQRAQSRPAQFTRAMRPLFLVHPASVPVQMASLPHCRRPRNWPKPSAPFITRS